MVSMKQLSSQEQGFSLVELMLVTSIIGLISGISLPLLTRNLENEQLNAATKVAAAWLDDIRRQAIQNSTPCRVVVDSVNTSLNGSCDDLANSSSSLKLSDEIQSKQPITLTRTDTGNTEIVFTPRGTATSGAELELSFAGSPLGRCLRVMAPLGLVRLGQRIDSACRFSSST